MFGEFKKSMMMEFEMTDRGLMHYFLGLEVIQTTAGNFIYQKKYAQDILNRFQMDDYKPFVTPAEHGLKLCKDKGGKEVDSTFYKQIIGSLMYLTYTRPDIMYAVSLVSRYMEKPTEMHLNAAKRILREDGSGFVGYTDSDYAGDIDDRKSTSGHTFLLNSGAVSWSSKKQQIVTLSSTEAEYVAATASSCQAMWLRKIFEVLGDAQKGPTTIYCDNMSTIKLSRNPVMHGRSKHIDVRFHFLRDLCSDEKIVLEYCKSGE
ncbi:unnamed protein product [Prunus armeniaca]